MAGQDERAGILQGNILSAASSSLCDASERAPGKGELFDVPGLQISKMCFPPCLEITH